MEEEEEEEQEEEEEEKKEEDEFYERDRQRTIGRDLQFWGVSVEEEAFIRRHNKMNGGRQPLSPR